MPRPPLANPPACPRPGHDAGGGYRVSKDGRYGTTTVRQLFRCVAPDGVRHRFAPELPREHTTDGICDHCDTPLVPHTGPVVSRDYWFRLRLVAEALYRVGSGASYAAAADITRAVGGRFATNASGSGHLVMEWTDFLGSRPARALQGD
jgi:hypothetical protein